MFNRQTTIMAATAILSTFLCLYRYITQAKKALPPILNRIVPLRPGPKMD